MTNNRLHWRQSQAEAVECQSAPRHAGYTCHSACTWIGIPSWRPPDHPRCDALWRTQNLCFSERSVRKFHKALQTRDWVRLIGFIFV